MVMKKVKNLAGTLFYISRICAFAYALLAVYSATSLLTGWKLGLNGAYFNILLPFTGKTVLIGEYNLRYIFFDFLFVFILYYIFFWLLGNVFKAFTQPKLFNEKNIRRLKYFYRANLFVPSLAIFIAYIFSTIDRDVIILDILHFIIGVFSYFIAEIFKQGANLQNEQDLFI
jgi:hypothetical protein